MSLGDPLKRQAFSLAEREFLLRLARHSLSAGAEDGHSDADLSEPTESLKRHRGCFVTLFKNGELRGCIGHVLPKMPLYKAVSNNARAAGFHDTRFKPVSPDEVRELDIEISVLSDLVPVAATDAAGILAALTPGLHGVLLREQGQMSTFLPQVWEILPEKEEFLSRLCLKGGWEADDWKSGRLAISTYTVVSFSNHSM